MNFQSILKLLQLYISDRQAASAIEYGLIAAGISLAIVAAIFATGDNIESMYQAMEPAMDAIPEEIEVSR